MGDVGLFGHILHDGQVRLELGHQDGPASGDGPGQFGELAQASLMVKDGTEW